MKKVVLCAVLVTAILQTAQAVELFNGTVYLPPGNFTKLAEDGLAKEINWRTALGALEAASLQGNFNYTIKTSPWGIFVDCIAGICSGDMGETSGWMYQVNGNVPMVSCSEYMVNNSDKVVWYFARNMSETVQTSPKVIKINVSLTQLSSITREFPAKVRPNEIFNVTLSVAVTPSIGVQINEYVPQGFKYVNYTYSNADNVVFNQNENILTFTVVDMISTDGFSVTYTLKAPSTEGMYVCLGTSQILNGEIEVINGSSILNVSDDVRDDLEQLVTKYYPSFDWKTETPTKDDVINAITIAVIEYFSTTDTTEQQQIVEDLTNLIILYFTL